MHTLHARKISSDTATSADELPTPISGDDNIIIIIRIDVQYDTKSCECGVLCYEDTSAAISGSDGT